MTLQDVKHEMEKRGLTPHEASWEDEKQITVFSEELIDGLSFGGSEMVITFNKASKSLFIQ